MTQLTGFPDFFVVGAPRCGTTALCRYLASNPQICLSRPKEPHYFARYSGVSSAAKIQRDYIDRYFAHRGSAHRAVGEGSVSYLYLPGVITRILEFNPEARFIAMVRSPLTMLPSYHLRMQYLLQEDEADFATAWRQQEVRARGENVPRRCLETRLLMYGEVTRFGQQVDTLFKVAGRERAHVIVFEDFVANTLMEYRNVLKFLHVDYDGQTRFVRRYQSQM
ncbi:MAG: sulfotransferase family protein, partial [Lysobacterales bacterium]